MFTLNLFKQLSRVVTKERLKMLPNAFLVVLFASLMLGAGGLPFHLKVLSEDSANKGTLLEGGSYCHHKFQAL